MEIIHEKKFHYVEEGEGETLMLLHGLFGALSNFGPLFDAFKSKYRVVIPILPIFDLPLPLATLNGLVSHVQSFVKFKGLDSVSVMGNSLGGHIALIYALKNKAKVRSIILTGSSGLFESSLGDTFPKRGDYEFIKNRTELTFYDPKMATKELVDEVFEIVNNRSKALRVISTAKSAIRQNLAKKLHQLDHPSLLIWGKNDTITPPFVGEEFAKLLPNSQLEIVENCGHAPMMERPEVFNPLLEDFLAKVYATSS